MTTFYIVEMFDYFYDMNCIVGVYSTLEKANDAINMLLRWIKKRDPENVPESRLEFEIEPISLDLYTDVVTEWFSED